MISWETQKVGFSQNAGPGLLKSLASGALGMERNTYLELLGLGVDVSQMQENLERLIVLHSSLEDLSQGLLRTVHVFQVQQCHPHVQLFLLLPGGRASRT